MFEIGLDFYCEVGRKLTQCVGWKIEEEIWDGKISPWRFCTNESGAKNSIVCLHGSGVILALWILKDDIEVISGLTFDIGCYLVFQDARERGKERDSYALQGSIRVCRY